MRKTIFLESEQLWSHKSGGDSYSIIILVKVFSDHGFMPRQSFFKIRKGITGNTKRRGFDKTRKLVEPVKVGV